VFRGGSWYDSAINARCAIRLYYSPGGTYINIGFRPALVPSIR